MPTEWRSDDGFRVVSKGLLRTENAWTTLELRPDSACLESAWPSFISRNLRSYPSQSGVLLRRRGRVQSRLVGVEGWNIVVDTRACRHTTNPEPNVTFDVRRKKRVKESKYANFSSYSLFYVSRLLFVYPSRVRFPWRNYPLPTLLYVQFATLGRSDEKALRKQESQALETDGER